MECPWTASLLKNINPDKRPLLIARFEKDGVHWPNDLVWLKHNNLILFHEQVIRATSALLSPMEHAVFDNALKRYIDLVERQKEEALLTVAALKEACVSDESGREAISCRLKDLQQAYATQETDSRKRHRSTE